MDTLLTLYGYSSGGGGDGDGGGGGVTRFGTPAQICGLSINKKLKAMGMFNFSEQNDNIICGSTNQKFMGHLPTKCANGKWSFHLDGEHKCDVDHEVQCANGYWSKNGVTDCVKPGFFICPDGKWAQGAAECNTHHSPPKPDFVKCPNGEWSNEGMAGCNVHQKPKADFFKCSDGLWS